MPHLPLPRLTVMILGSWAALAPVAKIAAQDGSPTVTGGIIMLPDNMAGRATASGEKYDPSERTAAHRTLPLGSLAWVTNVANGRSVLVRINDRGPAPKKQEMALSRNSAEAIGLHITGEAQGLITPVDVAVRAPAAGAGQEEFAIAVATYPEMLRAIYRQMGLERNGVANVKLQRLNRQGGTYYRVIIGGFATPEAASAAAVDLEARKLIEPR